MARAVRGASGMVTTLPPFPDDHQGPVSPLDTQGLDVGAGRFGDPQPVERQQGDQRMLGGRAKPGSDQQRAKLVTVEPGSVRFVVQAGPPHVGGGRVIEEFFFDGIAVEPRDGAEPTGDRGPCAAAGFQVAGETLDVRPPGLKQAQVMLLAPAGELPQVQFVGLTGQAGVAGQEPSQRQLPWTGKTPAQRRRLRWMWQTWWWSSGTSRVGLRPRRLGQPKPQRR